MLRQNILRWATAILTGLLLTGCAAPITLYSLTPKDSKPAKIEINFQPNTLGTFIFYENPEACTGQQVVSVLQQNGSKTVYLAHSKYLTFQGSVYFRGEKGTMVGTSIYTIPFEKGDRRIYVTHDQEHLYTVVESNEAGRGYILAEEMHKRTPHQPFLQTGEWCKPDASLNIVPVPQQPAPASTPAK
jgi:hypothetical protein